MLRYFDSIRICYHLFIVVTLKIVRILVAFCFNKVLLKICNQETTFWLFHCQRWACSCYSHLMWKSDSFDALLKSFGWVITVTLTLFHLVKSLVSANCLFIIFLTVFPLYRNLFKKVIKSPQKTGAANQSTFFLLS